MSIEGKTDYDAVRETVERLHHGGRGEHPAFLPRWGDRELGLFESPGLTIRERRMAAQLPLL